MFRLITVQVLLMIAMALESADTTGKTIERLNMLNVLYDC